MYKDERKQFINFMLGAKVNLSSKRLHGSVGAQGKMSLYEPALNMGEFVQIHSDVLLSRFV